MLPSAKDSFRNAYLQTNNSSQNEPMTLIENPENYIVHDLNLKKDEWNLVITQEALFNRVFNFRNSAIFMRQI